LQENAEIPDMVLHQQIPNARMPGGMQFQIPVQRLRTYAIDHTESLYRGL
jgi:hypothetical protein